MFRSSPAYSSVRIGPSVKAKARLSPVDGLGAEGGGRLDHYIGRASSQPLGEYSLGPEHIT